MNKKMLLKDLCFEDAWGQYGIPASAEEYDINKVRYLRITDISDHGDLLHNDKKSVSAYDIDKYFLKEGDIVFARTGNSTGRTYYHESKNGTLAFAGFLIKYSLDENKINPKYLKFYTISNEYKAWVKNLSVGSTRGNINAQTFGNCPITVPIRHQQDLLVKTLSILSDKIDLNNRIIAELQAMVSTLYEYWFLQFDFPDNSNKPFKANRGKLVWNKKLKKDIPFNWGEKSLSELTTISSESVNPLTSPDKAFKHYSIPAYDENESYKIEKGVEIRSNKFTVRESDLLVSKLNPWFNRVVYGKKEEDAICSTEFVVWRPENTAIKNYLNIVARSAEFISYCSQSATGTSNSHKRVNPTVMMQFNVPFNKEIVEKFGNQINPAILMIEKNKTENRTLSELRDWLLPMLMNGQVKVNAAEEKLSMAAESKGEYKSRNK